MLLAGAQGGQTRSRSARRRSWTRSRTGWSGFRACLPHRENRSGPPSRRSLSSGGGLRAV